MAADPRDLTTVDNLVSWLNLNSPNQGTQDMLQRLVTAVSLWIQTWLSRAIPSAVYTEVYNGHGGTRLSLSNYPVTAVSSVVVDGVAIPASSGAGQAGWILANDQVILNGYRFTLDAGNVQVAYTAGYADVPPDLEQACLELASMRFKERDRIGHSSAVMAGQQVNFIIKDMPADVATILQQYRKVVPC